MRRPHGIPPGIRRALTASAALLAGAVAAAPVGAQGWRQNQLLIGGQALTPFGDAAMYKRLADAGIDLVVAVDSTNLAPIDSALLAARTVQGLRDTDPAFRLRLLSVAIGPKGRPGDLPGNPDPQRNAAPLRATLDSLGRYASVAGFWLWDEPADSATMSRAAALARFVARESPGRLPYVNLFASYVGDPRQHGAVPDRWRATYGADKRRAYPDYIDDWLRRWKDEPYPAPLLSFDHYTFEPKAFVWDDYLLSLKIARDKAAQWSRPGQRIPLWVFVQLAGNRARKMVPTVAQVRFQVYAALAYGARGIMYWTLCPTHADPGYAPALLDERGGPTDRYDAIARLDAEVHALGPTLVRLEPVVVHYTELGGQIGIENDLFSRPGGVPGIVTGEFLSDTACMVAQFRDRRDSTDYLLVVNRDLSRARSFRLQLAARADSVQLVRRTDGARALVGTALQAIEVSDLPPGTGELYRVTR